MSGTWRWGQSTALIAVLLVLLLGGAARADAAVTTFATPGQYTYVVPAGVTEIEVTAIGGEGETTGVSNPPSVYYGGRGALVRGRIAVEPGQTFYAVVGSDADGTTPGANGGGAVAVGCVRPPGAGGGASDLRTSPLSDLEGSAASRVLIAGGGGGAGGFGTNGDGGAGGNRGESGRFGEGEPEDLPGEGGRGARNGNPPGAGEERTGTPTTGGPGSAPGVVNGGCGGGGGGGFGGGAGGQGATGTGTAGGGGGGGGGSLHPEGRPFGRTAPPGAVPSVVIDDSPPEVTGVLSITPNVYVSTLNSFGDCPQSAVCGWCGRGEVGETNCPMMASNNGNWDAGFASQQNWGAAGLQRPYRGQSGVGINPAPQTRAELGEPFALGDLAHFNIPIRGDSPTRLGLGGRVTLELPAGDPVILPIGTHTWTSGNHPVVQIDFKETSNDPPCDPEIQVTDTNCDDRFAINDEVLAPAPVTVDGVTFTFTHRGFKDPDGTFDAPLITEELQPTAGSFFAQITASSNPTSIALTVGEGPELTAAISPVPWTGDGAVEFRADGQAIQGCTTVAADPESGAATCTPAALKPGTHSVKASYSGGVGFAASESDAVELVIPLPPFGLKVNRVKLRKALRSGLVVKVVGAEAGRLKLIAKKGPKAVAAGATQIGETGEGSVKLKFKRWAKKKFADAKRLRLKISGGGGQTKVTLKR